MVIIVEITNLEMGDIFFPALKSKYPDMIHIRDGDIHQTRSNNVLEELLSFTLKWALRVQVLLIYGG